MSAVRPPFLLLVSGVAATLTGCAHGSRPNLGEGLPSPASEITQVVLLGTGTPNAEPDRWGAAVAIVVNGTPYLVDAGAGVVRRASAAFSQGVEGLEVKRLSTLFLTHLHSDHTVGLPDLIYSPWVLERERPLRIFGPIGTEAMASHLTRAFEADVRVRLQGLEPANPTGHRVETTEIQPGVIFRDENVTVTAFLVDHGSWPLAFGYRFETPDRVVVVSGDTAPTEAIVEYCDGCDILVHEVYSQAGFDRRAPEWQRYHAASHTSAPALGEIATRAGARLLVLTHQLLWGSTPEELLAEVRSTFDGSVVYGNDLDVF
ncbi:MAG: MBL fold metallo-hydrolase [Longimicrobiales bacterium]